MSAGHAALMDGVYRRQRHIYDLTRKYYLLGRDRLIEDLAPPPGGAVRELGCGTGRNLSLVARRHPSAKLFGIDISSRMLETASANFRRAGLRVALAQADATTFDAKTLFGRETFDRVFVSYSLSMIPQWQRALAAALDATAPGGSLHLVDFGRQEHLPGWFRAGLRAWLRRFHVTPRDELHEVLESESRKAGASCRFDSLFGGYAVIASARRAA
jgi:S-adenosylmethionine-diacylgycerolhomoserine-N-methlytransferase